MGDTETALGRCTRRDDHLLLRKEQTHVPDASKVLRRLLNDRVIVRLFRGAYVEASFYGTLQPWGQYDLQARALGEVSGRVLVGYSAAALWKLWRYEPTPVQHEIHRRNGGGKRTRSTVREVSGALPDEDIVGEHVKATTVPRTLVDLTRLHGFGAGFVAACSALRQKLVTREDLAAYDVAGMEGLAHWPLVVEKATGVVESALEAAFLAQSVFFGDFTLIPQVSVRGSNGRNYLIDFRVEGTEEYVETDGRGKYGASASEQEFNLKKEKERADNLPVRPERFGWAEVMSMQAYRRMLDKLGCWHRWDLPRIHW